MQLQPREHRELALPVLSRFVRTRRSLRGESVLFEGQVRQSVSFRRQKISKFQRISCMARSLQVPACMPRSVASAEAKTPPQEDVGRSNSVERTEWPPALVTLEAHDPSWSSRTAHDPWPVGTIVGERYLVDRTLARGRSSTVYGALDERTQQPCAIKCFGSRSHPEERDHFRVQFARSLGIPSRIAVPFLDGGFHDARPFVVTPLLRGMTLAARVRFGPLDVWDVLRYGILLSSALGSAHEMGIVHGDLRPTSVFLVRDEHRTSVRLLDLGMAIAEGERALELMAHGSKYAAPELANEPTSRTIQADVWSLGRILHEATFGPDSLGQNQAENRPSLATLHSIFEQCTAPNPSLRFASCAELRRALVSYATIFSSEVQDLR